MRSRKYTCSAESQNAGWQVIVVHPIAASLTRAEAAVDPLAAQDADVGRHVRIDALQHSSRHCNSADQPRLLPGVLFTTEI